MTKIAIDVVLLPPEEVTAEAIAANRELVAAYSGDIVLSSTGCLPHISLAMGCLQEKDIPAVGKILEKIARECPLPELTITGIVTSTTPAGEEISVYEVENTPQLQALHERVMNTTGPFLTHDDLTPAMINADRVSPNALDWITHYPEKAAFQNFHPHITVGYGRLAGGKFPRCFSGGRLALCHLGNHCTCTEILAAYNLKNKG